MTSINQKLLVAFALCIPALVLTKPVWIPQSSGVTARLRGVSAVNDLVAWASGSQGTVLRTADGGTTWQMLTVTSDSVDFRDVDAIDARTAYVLSIGNGPASRIYKTTDSGATWNEQFRSRDDKEFFDAMSFWDRDHGLVIGDSIEGQFCVLTTENGGKDWKRVPANALPPALPDEAAFAASGTNIAVNGGKEAWIGMGAAARARVLHTRDRGRTWKVYDTPIKSGRSSGIFSIAFRDAKHGVVVGGDYSKENEAIENLAMTSDGGATWTLSKGLSGFRSAVAYVPGAKTSTLIAVGPSGTDYSRDDGRSWMALEGPGFDSLSFARGRPIAWGSGARGAIGRLVGVGLVPTRPR